MKNMLQKLSTYAAQHKPAERMPPTLSDFHSVVTLHGGQILLSVKVTHPGEMMNTVYFSGNRNGGTVQTRSGDQPWTAVLNSDQFGTTLNNDWVRRYYNDNQGRR